MASQIVSSIAPAVFSQDLVCELEKLAGQKADIKSLVISDLIFITSAAVHPEYISENSRATSFSALPISIEKVALSRWTDAGFFVPSAAPSAQSTNGVSVSCFHCGAQSHFVADLQDPVQLHRRCSPSCQLARLLSFVSTSSNTTTMTSTLSGDMSATAASLRRATVKLHADLRSSGLLDQVESYGFERRLVAFCICRLFMRSKDGQVTSRSGDLIQTMQDSEDMLRSLPTELDLENALNTLDSLSATISTAQVQQTAVVNESTAEIQVSKKQEISVSVMASQIDKTTGAETQDKATESDDDSDDDKCTVCKLRVRDQVTLPCAHFLLCRQCASERRNCPRCDKHILATVRAFIA